MNKGFSGEISRLLLLLGICAGIGVQQGELLLTLGLGLLGYLGWSLWNLRRFSRWLAKSDKQPPPDASGIWAELADTIINAQRRQRRERELLQGVIKRGQETTAALRDGIILLNRELDIDWYNSAAEQLLGLRRGDIGNSVLNFVRHPQFRHYLSDADFSDPIDLPSPQNDAVRLQYQVNRFGQGEYLVVVRDITRVFKLEQMRKDFVANLSHELKTPLTVIRGYLETINLSPDLPERWQAPLQQAEQQSLRMTSLLQDLTELSKLETNDNLASHRPVDLAELLRQIQADSLALSGERRHAIRLKCPDGLRLLGNEKELRSAFSNLTFNAVKYSPPGTEISVRVRRHALGLVVSVKDKGPGIDSVHLPRLTERFYRVDASRHARTGGTGLGLAIVKHVMLRHGGRLNIRSRLGKGSRFSCVFPPQKILPAEAEEPALKAV